jgi:uncharacterized protein involved in response to NO
MKPFRPFFLLAALDAIIGAAAWLPLSLVADVFGTAGPSAADWHRNLLLFAMVPAILSGFVLTALPRWTRRPVPPHVAPVVIALSLVSRCFFLLLVPALGLAVAALQAGVLAAVTAGTVIASGDRRNLKIVLLLAVFAGSAAMTAFFPQADYALRSALASIVGLMLIIGGRVVPALTASYVEHIGDHVEIRRSAIIENAAAIAAMSALAGWVVAPQSGLTGFASIIAAGAHLLRLAQWRGWRAHASAVFALHIGYGWIVAGFALLACNVLAPASVTQAAFLHAWTVGGIGTMGLAIMASMIRRHGRRPFARSVLGTASFAAITLSALSRQLAELSPLELWMSLSAVFWLAAFGLFLAAFGRMLLVRRS